MSSKIKTQYLLPGFFWPPDKDSTRKEYLMKLDKEIKSHFSYVEDKQNKQRGYRQGEFSLGSALALYVCRYLGDGIYFSDDPEVLAMFTGTSQEPIGIVDVVYLLVVSDGKVLAGTDIFVKRELFDYIIEQIPRTEYSDLSVKLFTTEDLNELNRKFIGDMVYENKTKTVVWGLALIVFLLFCVGGLAWFFLMA